jgi:seryl-tRNA synthetase
MLDIKLLREKPEEIRQAFQKRLIDLDLTKVFELDAQRRA